MRREWVGFAVAVMLVGLLAPVPANPSQREPGFFARSASVPSLEASSPPAEPGAAGLVMLVGFLGLIAGLLTHWSRDASCRAERSVFQSDETA